MLEMTMANPPFVVFVKKVIDSTLMDITGSFIKQDEFYVYTGSDDLLFPINDSISEHNIIEQITKEENKYLSTNIRLYRKEYFTRYKEVSVLILCLPKKSTKVDFTAKVSF